MQQISAQDGHSSSSVSPCFYGPIERDGRFYVLCLGCWCPGRKVHGLIDSQTKRPLSFETQASARKVCRLLNVPGA